MDDSQVNRLKAFRLLLIETEEKTRLLFVGVKTGLKSSLLIRWCKIGLKYWASFSSVSINFYRKLLKELNQKINLVGNSPVFSRIGLKKKERYIFQVSRSAIDFLQLHGTDSTDSKVIIDYLYLPRLRIECPWQKWTVCYPALQKERNYVPCTWLSCVLTQCGSYFYFVPLKIRKCDY